MNAKNMKWNCIQNTCDASNCARKEKGQYTTIKSNSVDATTTTTSTTNGATKLKGKTDKQMRYAEKKSSTGTCTVRTCVLLECLNFLIGKFAENSYLHERLRAYFSFLPIYATCGFLCYFIILQSKQVASRCGCASCICACVCTNGFVVLNNESVCRRFNENRAEFYWCETHILGGFSFVYVSMTNARSLTHSYAKPIQSLPANAAVVFTFFYFFHTHWLCVLCQHSIRMLEIVACLTRCRKSE